MKRKTLMTSLLSGVFALTLCATIPMAGVNASAAGAENLGERYFHAVEGTMENYHNKSGVLGGSYKNWRVEATPDAQTGRVEVVYNGVITPSKEIMLGHEASTADAIVYSYRSLSHSDMVLNVIWTRYEDSGNVYGTMKMSFTDEYTVEGNGVTITGTEQAVVGYNPWYNTSYNNSAAFDSDKKYTPFGYHTTRTEGGGTLLILESKSKPFSPYVQNDTVRFQLTTSGEIQTGTSSNTPTNNNILDEEFLAASVENLPSNHELRELYTAEYAQKLLAELQGGCKFSVSYIGAKQTESFHLRKVNGCSILDSATTIGANYSKPYAEPKSQTLYVGHTYSTTDLVTAYNTHREGSSTEDTSYAAGYYGIHTEAWGSSANGGTYFSNNGAVKSFTPSELGEFKIAVQIASHAAANSEQWGPIHYLTMQVVEGNPEVTAKEGAMFVAGKTHDLRDFFDVWAVGDNVTYAFTVDGEPVSGNEYTATASSKEVAVTVTDARGKTDTLTAEFPVAALTVPETVTATGYVGDAVPVPVPEKTAGVEYTLAIYNASNELLSNDVAYAFTESGTYRIVYEMWVLGEAVGVTCECAYTLTLTVKAPTITVDGSYAESYTAQNVVQLHAATASNGKDSFTVVTKVYKDDELQTVEGTSLALTAGAWKIVYACAYDTDLEVTKEYAFTVAADNEAPIITVIGNYQANYDKGITLTLFGATAVDNSGEEMTVEILVTKDGKTVEVTDGKISLNAAGNYTVTYVSTDKSGNKAETPFTFTVKAEEESGCGCVVAPMAGACVAIALLACLRRRKEQ